MPKKKASRSAANSSKKKIKSNKAGRAKPQESISDVLTQAQEALDVYDYTKAQLLCQKALQIDNDSIQALEMTGELLTEVGDFEGAKSCFGRATQLQPNNGHSKYLYLGELLTGDESEQCFRKAIEIMRNMVEAQENFGTASDTVILPTKKQISDAFLSIAELYMTDLCDEDRAEEACRSSIQSAIEYDGKNPEAYQVMADFHLVKGEMDKAKEMILKSISLWLPLAREATDEQETEGANSITDMMEPIKMPIDAQLKTARTLIEVEEYAEATDVLEILLAQDEDMVEVWYLLGWANYLQGDDFKSTAKFYLEKCKKVAKKTKYGDASVKQHVEELLTELADIHVGEDEEHPAEDLETHLVELDAEYEPMDHC